MNIEQIKNNLKKIQYYRKSKYNYNKIFDIV